LEAFYTRLDLHSFSPAVFTFPTFQAEFGTDFTMGKVQEILQHPDELLPLVQMLVSDYRTKQMPLDPGLAFCYGMLNRVSRRWAYSSEIERCMLSHIKPGQRRLPVEID
jgi:hypothetical protein